MNFEEFWERMDDGEMRFCDIPVLAAIILAAIIVVVVWVGCVLWFFAILTSAVCNGAAELLMLIPCAIIFSVLTAIICFVEAKIKNM